MVEKIRFTLRVPEDLYSEIGVVTKASPNSMNGVYIEMLQYALAKKFGATSTKKQHFLRQNMILDMQSQDKIATFDAQIDQIKYEFTKKALILSGNFGIELEKEDRLRYSIDLAEYLRSAGEIDPERYESYVKVIKKILSKSQFDNLKKLI